MSGEGIEMLQAQLEEVEQSISSLSELRQELNKKILNHEKDYLTEQIKNLNIDDDSKLMAVVKDGTWPVFDLIEVLYDLQIDYDASSISCILLRYKSFEDEHESEVTYRVYSFKSFLRLFEEYSIYTLSPEEFQNVMNNLLHFSYKTTEYSNIVKLLHNEIYSELNLS